MKLDPNNLLSSLPAGLRDPLFETYLEIASNYAEHRWEPSELNGGKFCEVVYTILDGATSGVFASTPSKPTNIRDACLNLEGRPATGLPGDRSLRILLPRSILPLYEIRNNRGVGHVGGDVNPNLMDATAVYAAASWIVGEIIRVFHGVSIAEAQEAVDALSERKLPLIWAPGSGIKRVLDTKLSASDQTLVLLHQSVAWVSDTELCESVEYTNFSAFRTKILGKLHIDRMIEYERSAKRARISPRGSTYVEQEIIRPHIN